MNGFAEPSQAFDASPVKPRLLLVEDEPSMRQLLCDLLGTDYALTVAVDGERAWELAQTQSFDLVLTDMEMPGLDGLELTRRLRAQAHTAHLPILLLSANNRPSTVIQALEANADDFLLKPFRPQELLARVRHRLRICEMRRDVPATNGAA